MCENPGHIIGSSRAAPMGAVSDRALANTSQNELIFHWSGNFVCQDEHQNLSMSKVISVFEFRCAFLL